MILRRRHAKKMLLGLGVLTFLLLFVARELDWGRFFKQVFAMLAFVNGAYLGPYVYHKWFRRVHAPKKPTNTNQHGRKKAIYGYIFTAVVGLLCVIVSHMKDILPPVYGFGMLIFLPLFFVSLAFSAFFYFDYLVNSYPEKEE